MTMIEIHAERLRRRLPWLLVAALLAGGCAALQPPQEESPDLHVLATGPVAAVPGTRRDLVLEVGVPRARAGFDTPQMVYVRQPYELDHYAKSRWADTPARMLGPLIAQALEQSGAFRAVVAAPGAVPGDVRVDTEIVRLQQDFMVRPSRVELALHVQLIDVRGRRVLATRTFDEAEAAPSEDARGGVLAANAALQRALERVVEFCASESVRR